MLRQTLEFESSPRLVVPVVRAVRVALTPRSSVALESVNERHTAFRRTEYASRMDGPRVMIDRTA